MRAKENEKCTNRYIFSETFFLPKIKIPKKTDSRKKAKTPSAAGGAPKISPTVIG